MNILVLGSQGQVGWELTRSLLPLGKVIALGRSDLEMSDPVALRRAVHASEPHLIINAAAYTAVDKAETDEAAAMAVNAVAPGILAKEALRSNTLLIHYSTDYVFDGQSNQPYVETDSTNPQSVYGRSKLAGEKAIADTECDYLILRTSWVYGARGHNFLRTMLRLGRERESLRVADDQIGAPTWSRWIADATAQVARQAMDKRAAQAFQHDTYHLACAGATSWHGFASAIIEQHRLLNPTNELTVKAIVPISTAEYPLPAKRPANSRLDCHKLAADYGIVAPDWQQALQLCMMDLSEGR